MPKKTIEFYEVIVKFTVRQKYWIADNGVMTREVVADKIQQGVEVPIEDVEVTIRE